jgi:hypothetical protein
MLAVFFSIPLNAIVLARYQAGKIMLKQLLCSPDLSPL